jgi:hypothetical protein
LSGSIEIEILETPRKAEASRTSRCRGSVIERRAECANAADSIRVNSDSPSNETDESVSQYEKHAEQRV